MLTGTTSVVDQYFKNTTTGAALTSDISQQLLRVARMIEARGDARPFAPDFFASQGGYDTHANQVDVGIDDDRDAGEPVHRPRPGAGRASTPR